MILDTDKFSTACQSILTAIDSKNVSLYTETMELVANGTVLSMNVTNREYFVTVNFDLPASETFKASINAELFLKLVSKITSPTIELTIEGNAVKIEGNGTYKIPFTYNNSSMFELPKIVINNVTDTMTIKSSILQSILQYNSKELQRGTAVRPVQKYFYLDEDGCITFTSGACVNSFKLQKPIKVLLGEKVVKLFKLFKDVDDVEFSIGVDQVTPEISQTKVKFVGGGVELTAILADAGLVSEVPVQVIRGMTTKQYAKSVKVNRKVLLESLTRLMLFNETKNYGKLTFTPTSIEISDWGGDNKEKVPLIDTVENLSYYAVLNMATLNLVISGCEDEELEISFGDSKAFVFKKQSICDIIPEIKASVA